MGRLKVMIYYYNIIIIIYSSNFLNSGLVHFQKSIVKVNQTKLRWEMFLAIEQSFGVKAPTKVVGL